MPSVYMVKEKVTRHKVRYKARGDPQHKPVTDFVYIEKSVAQRLGDEIVVTIDSAEGR